MDASAQAKGALAAAVAGAAADLSRGMSSISPAEQMAIVEAAQRAARESDGGMLIARNHSSDEAMVGSWVSSMEAVWGSLAAVEARKQHSTDSNTGSSSANGSVSRAAEGTAGGVAACRKAARSAVEDATAAGDGRTAAVGAEGSDAQQEQARAMDPQKLQPSVATQAS